MAETVELMRLLNSLGIDTSDYVIGLKKAETATDSTGKKIGADLKQNAQTGADGLNLLNKGFESVFGISLTAAGGIALVSSVIKDSINAALESEAAQAATAATIQATGREAESTSRMVDQLAASEMYLTGVDDETVRSGTNVLLTFGSLGNDILPRVTKAAMDYAAAQSQGNLANLDITGSAQSLGMALNTFDGYTRLTRQLGKLTPEQEAAIKQFSETNDLLGYQEYILGIVESKFGGMAEALGGTNLGKINKAKTALSELEENIGARLIPILGAAAQAANDLMTGMERVQGALNQHNDEVAKTSTSYAEYTVEMQRAAGVTGKLITEKGNLVKVTSMLGFTALEMVQKNFLLSESEWEAARAADEQAASAANAGTALEQQQAAVDAMTKANEGYLTELDHWQKMETNFQTSLVDHYEKRTKLTTEYNDLLNRGYKESSDKAQQKLAEIEAENQAIADLEAAHVKETNTVILGYMEQILAADGLTTAEVDALIKQGIQWGIYDADMQATFDAAIKKAGDLVKEIGQVQGKAVDIWITTHRQTINDTWDSAEVGGNTVLINKPTGTVMVEDNGVKKPKGPGGATGLDMIVPPGFGEDSFPVWTTSGEHVSVETPGQQSNAGMDMSAVLEALVRNKPPTADEIATALAVKIQLLGLL